MSVRITPGRTSKTPMPAAPRRVANSLVIMLTPLFERQYSPRLGDAANALADEMLTIEQYRRGAVPARKPAATRWVRKNGPRRFTRIRSSKLSGEASRRSPRFATLIPALFTRQLIGPI